MSAPRPVRVRKQLSFIVAQLEMIATSENVSLDQICTVFENIKTSDLLDEWPIVEVYPLFANFLQQGSDSETDKKLVSELKKIFSGMGRPAGVEFHEDKPIEFKSKYFCFTGIFEFGTRKECEAEVLALGAKVTDTVRRNLDYLVIGKHCSPDWKYLKFGTKLKAVCEANLGSKRKIRVVSEDFWATSITKKRAA